jgi:hypothetical protein
VVTTQLHGPALALRWGIPALARGPDRRGRQAERAGHTWQGPALVAAESVVRDGRGTVKLQYWWRWCLSPQRRQLAAERAASPPPGADDLVGERPDTHEASVLKPR